MNPLIRSNLTPGGSSQQKEAVLGAGKLGMRLFLASLSMLFAASMVGYLVIRFRQESWPPPGMPALPKGLWLSTSLILAASYVIQKSLTFIRSGNQKKSRQFLFITTCLGFLFLITQTWNGYGLITVHLTMSVNLYAFTFFMLTGLHAIHVIGGIIQLSIVTAKAYRNEYDQSHHPGILYSAMYWHFLDGVWLVMFAVLVLAG